MEETIPEDVLKAARDYWVDATMAARPGEVISTIDLIARAIMAERERCAKVAETTQNPPPRLVHPKTGNDGCDKIRAAIATSIRSGV